MSAVVTALEVALVAHYGQKDKCGEPYIGHLLRVAAKVADDEDAMTVAMLHDIVEDTEVSLIALAPIFPQRILDAVSLLTRMGAQKYFEYIEAVKANPLALRVKIADIEDNLSPERRYPGDESLRERHQKALDILTAHQLSFEEGAPMP